MNPPCVDHTRSIIERTETLVPAPEATDNQSLAAENLTLRQGVCGQLQFCRLLES